ncbi:MAG TPA: IS701 family transposase [Ktedonobacterales bacterium]|nr:IS701 family transposase [Ktedonobacterales bacterium]
MVAPLERKTSWQLAELVQDTTPDRRQRLRYRVPWDAEAARDRLEPFVLERCGDPEGIGVLDETGIPKKGTRSVGVAKQYGGAVGKREHCQVATLLTYASPRGHGFLDRCLYLPEDWCGDRARRMRAPVPETVRFQTKPQQARAMLEHAWARGVPMRGVTGASVYGESTPLRQAIARAGKGYVLAVTSVTRVWQERPALLAPAERTGGRPRRNGRLAPGAPKPQPVAEGVAQQPPQRWRRLSVGLGANGARGYAWTRLRVLERRDDLPGPEIGLLARRAVSPPNEIAYSLASAPHTVPLRHLAQVASTRYTLAQCSEAAKGEAGFDRYAVRTWPRWYRHITLTMLAHAWLAERRSRPEQTAPGKTISRGTSGSIDGARGPTPARDRAAPA